MKEQDTKGLVAREACVSTISQFKHFQRGYRALARTKSGRRRRKKMMPEVFLPWKLSSTSGRLKLPWNTLFFLFWMCHLKPKNIKVFPVKTLSCKERWPVTHPDSFPEFALLWLDKVLTDLEHKNRKNFEVGRKFKHYRRICLARFSVDRRRPQKAATKPPNPTSEAFKATVCRNKPDWWMHLLQCSDT